jgi:hypothetical protein
MGLAAQTSRDASQQPTPAAHITVIGCVEPADQTRKNDDSKYKLSHAKQTKNDSTSSTGTSGSTSQSQNASTYRLDNSKDSTLAQDVGTQVEIIAVIEPPDTTSPTGTSGSNTSSANEPKLKVESIRVISTTCPQ